MNKKKDEYHNVGKKITLIFFSQRLLRRWMRLKGDELGVTVQ